MPNFGDLSWNTELQALDKQIVAIYKTYTKKDFARFDSYEQRFAAYQISENVSNSASYTQYLTVLQSVMSQNFLPQNWKLFVGMLRGGPAADPLAILKSGQINCKDIFLYAGMACNTAYNLYKLQLQSQGKSTEQIDQIDWLSLPHMKSIAAYVDNYVLTVYQTVNMTHQQVSTARGTFDIYGVFKTTNGFGNQADPNMQFWNASSFACMASHFSHLLTSQTIAFCRIANMATMSALWSWLEATGNGMQTSTAQWLTRIASFSCMTAFQLQAEKLLTSQNVAFDTFATSDKANGKWLTADAIAYTLQLLKSFTDWAAQYGIMEYTSIYYGFSFEQICLALFHCPCSDVYNVWSYIYYVHWYDVAPNLMNTASALSCPTNRGYSLLYNLNSVMDCHHYKIYVQPLFEPTVRTALQNEIPGLQYVSDDFIGPACGSNANFVFHFARNAANLSYIPYDLLVNYFLKSSTRVTMAKFCSSVGQDKYNWISPWVQIGNAGQDWWHIPDCCLFNIRLPGKPVLGPGAVIPQYSSSLPWMRFAFCYHSSQVFNPAGVQMTNDCFEPRQVVAQYQSFALVTHFIIAPSNMDASGTGPMSSNLLLPLNISGDITINGTVMPRTVNTTFSIPANPLITISHNGTTVAVRVLQSQFDPSVGDTSLAISQNCDTSCFQSDMQPSHLMYQIDPDSFKNGYAKLIFVHRNAAGAQGSSDPKCYRQVYLVGCGRTASAADMQSFTSVMANSTLSVSTTAVAATQYRKASSTNKYDVTINQDTVLTVQRNDCYSNDQRDFRAGIGSFTQSPWMLNNLARQVNGKEYMTFDSTKIAIATQPLTADQVYEPHLKKTQVTVPQSTAKQTGQFSANQINV